MEGREKSESISPARSGALFDSRVSGRPPCRGYQPYDRDDNALMTRTDGKHCDCYLLNCCSWRYGVKIIITSYYFTTETASLKKGSFFTRAAFNGYICVMPRRPKAPIYFYA